MREVLERGFQPSSFRLQPFHAIRLHAQGVGIKVARGGVGSRAVGGAGVVYAERGAGDILRPKDETTWSFQSVVGCLLRVLLLAHT